MYPFLHHFQAFNSHSTHTKIIHLIGTVQVRCLWTFTCNNEFQVMMCTCCRGCPVS
ncbi:hypothetical protein BDD12DRAFT_860193 [Trichophaea hybrida]|nr:hypothetical protein BDD12DRAFT_860193 [Trichophaea hybrida]